MEPPYWVMSMLNQMFQLLQRLVSPNHVRTFLNPSTLSPCSLLASCKMLKGQKVWMVSVYSFIYTVPLIDTTMRENILEVTMKKIQEKVTLGAGNFGNLILAQTDGLNNCDLMIGKSTDRTISVPVTLKMLKNKALSQQSSSLRRNIASCYISIILMWSAFLESE